MSLATTAVERCPVCDAGGGATLHAGLRDRVFGVAPGTWRLVRCPGCGAARLNPRPSDEVLASLYGDYYTHAPPAPNLVPTTAVGRALRALRNDHVNARLGYRLSPAFWPGRAVARVTPPLAAIAERGVRSLPAGGRLLDVGCGNGEFVAEATAAGWSAAGIDLDPVAVKAGRAAGLDLAIEDIAARAGREPGAYDAVTLSHVVEHVADPHALLQAARTLLRPGGHLWVATPNLDAAGHRAFGADWLGLDPPRHLVLFDAPSLARTLASAGFTAVRVLRPTPNAGRWFRISQAIRSGPAPAYEAPPAPFAVRLAGVRAELAAQRDRRHAEELLVLARRA
jgi:2-polyprenyl-3-methyl-5-hydroxy-6-metoxy-1,4-benzoquinol methylase